MQKCTMNRPITIISRKTLHWISAESPLFIPLLIISRIFSLLQVYAILFISGAIGGLNLFKSQIPFLSAFLILYVMFLRIFRNYIDCCSRRVSLSFAKKLNLKRIQISGNYEYESLSQKLFDYQQQNGGPVINGLKLLELNITGFISLIFSLVLIIVRCDSKVFMMLPLLILFTLCVSFLFVSRYSAVDGYFNEGLNILADNNRKGDFYYSVLSTDFSKMKSLRNYNTDNFVEKKYNRFMDPMIKLFNKELFAKFRISIAETLFSVFTTLVFCFVSGLYVAGKMPDLVSIFSVFSLTNFLLTFLRNSQQIRINNERMDEFLEFMNLETSKNKQNQHSDESIVLSMKDCCYAYPNSSVNSVDNFSFDFTKGRVYSLVGQNGSGKTTAIKLMTGLLYPTSGSVSVYDNNENRIIPYCPQNVPLFSFNLGENISMRPDYTKEKVNLILSEMGLDDFDSEIKIGPDFRETGIELSGGMTQRVNIGRVFYYSDDLMILDEPTSALDVFMEDKLYKLVRENAGDKTVIFVSHRLTSSFYSDEIIVMDAGKISDYGTHEELIEKNGIYRELFNLQKEHFHC